MNSSNVGKTLGGNEQSRPSVKLFTVCSELEKKLAYIWPSVATSKAIVTCSRMEVDPYRS